MDLSTYFTATGEPLYKPTFVKSCVISPAILALPADVIDFMLLSEVPTCITGISFSVKGDVWAHLIPYNRRESRVFTRNLARFIGSKTKDRDFSLHIFYSVPAPLVIDHISGN